MGNDALARRPDKMFMEFKKRLIAVERRIARGGSGPVVDGDVVPVPAPVKAYVNGLRDISATTWTDVPDVAVAMMVDAPLRVVIVAGAWMTATGGETRAAVAVTGANTVTPPAPGWGQTMYASSSDGSGTVQRSVQQVVDLQPGLTTFKMQAYRGGAAGVNQVNYAVLEVIPIAWVGSGPDALAPTRGDQALRDATFGIPVAEVERERMYGATWWRTDLGYQETYYPTHTPLGGSRPAGWYRTKYWESESWKAPVNAGIAERNGVGVHAHLAGAVVTLNVGLVLPAGGPDTTVVNNLLPRPLVTNQFLGMDGSGTNQTMWVTTDGAFVVRRNSATGTDTPFAATGTYITRDPILL